MKIRRFFPFFFYTFLPSCNKKANSTSLATSASSNFSIKIYTHCRDDDVGEKNSRNSSCVECAFIRMEFDFSLDNNW